MKLNTQLKTRTNSVVLFGPTAVGKTNLTENLFSKGFEIINADSVQIYKGMDIGSAKPSEETRRLIKHHLIDIKEIHEEYSSGEFVKDADKIIKEIEERGNVPLIAGGNAYYLKNLLFGHPNTPPSSKEVREKVRTLQEEKGKEYLYNLLKEIDPVTYEKININDSYRIKRAIEVYFTSDKPLSSFQVPSERKKYFIPIYLKRDKAVLNKMIEERTEKMFQDGLVKEVEGLIEKGMNKTYPAAKAIGYKEFLLFYERGNYKTEEIKSEIIKNTKSYAKRQITFFNSFKAPCFSPDDLEGIRKYLKQYSVIIP